MSGSQSLKRPLFFSGKLLTAEDHALEQQYVNEKLRRHNRSLHGFGIVSGLRVNFESGKIVVDSGMALDCQGNELVVVIRQPVSWQPNRSWQTAYVNIRYMEVCSDPVAVQGVAQASTIEEGFEITLAQENCNRGHRHLRGRWLACGEPHALTIAKLRRGPQGWRVDRRYRPPTIK
jgi:hypothetical protein